MAKPNIVSFFEANSDELKKLPIKPGRLYLIKDKKCIVMDDLSGNRIKFYENNKYFLYGIIGLFILEIGELIAYAVF